MRDVRHFFTKVSGVSYENSDGTSRQEIIGRCQVTEQLQLIPEPDNPHDPNAVGVVRENGEQIGYLRPELAKEVTRKNALGIRFGVFINDITGGTGKRPTFGVNLLVIVAEPGISDEEVQQYVNEVVSQEAFGEQVIQRARPRDEKGQFKRSGESSSGSGCVLIALLILLLFVLAIVVVPLSASTF